MGGLGNILAVIACPVSAWDEAVYRAIMGELVLPPGYIVKRDSVWTSITKEDSWDYHHDCSIEHRGVRFWKLSFRHRTSVDVAYFTGDGRDWEEISDRYWLLCDPDCFMRAGVFINDWLSRGAL